MKYSQFISTRLKTNILQCTEVQNLTMTTATYRSFNSVLCGVKDYFSQLYQRPADWERKTPFQKLLKV